MENIDDRGVIRFGEREGAPFDLKHIDMVASEKLLVAGLVRAGRNAAREYAEALRGVLASPFHAGCCMGRYEAYRQVLVAIGEGQMLPKSILEAAEAEVVGA